MSRPTAFAGLDERTVALVTAGAAGVGRAIAESLLACGVRVHVCDIDAAAVADFVAATPGVTGSVTDVADPASVQRLFGNLRDDFGGLNVLVNNAGIAGPTATVDNIDVKDWQRCIDVDLSGAFYCTRHAVPLLRDSGGGSIINISSSAALHGYPLRSPYAASKWGLIGLTKTWAMELGEHGIRVNAICPGSVAGPRIDQVIEREARGRGLEPDAVRDVYLKQTSLRVFVDAEDIGNMVRFLASDAGRHVSGQSIGLDGHTEGLANWLDK